MSFVQRSGGIVNEHFPKELSKVWDAFDSAGVEAGSVFHCID